MDHEFLEFGAYRENGAEVKHYICDDYNLWVWVQGGDVIGRFELHYNAWRVKYCDGAFLPGSEEFIMPAFFLIDLKFNCDAAIRSRLLEIRDSLGAPDASPAHAGVIEAGMASVHSYSHGP
jgi:hypothetical protein